MRRLTLIALFIATTAGVISGQGSHVSGYVIENGVRKPGVQIIVVGAHGIDTDNNGNFRIILPDKHFVPGQPVTIRVPGWTVFDPMFGHSTSRDNSFDFSTIEVSIIRPKSTLAHKDRRRLGKIVDAFQKENDSLLKRIRDYQEQLNLGSAKIQTLTAEVASLNQTKAKYEFLQKYAEEYEIPFEAIYQAMEDWSRNKKADDDLEAARQAVWRGDFKKAIELTDIVESIKDDLGRKNREEGLKLSRDRLDMYKVRITAFSGEANLERLYATAEKVDRLFATRQISKEDFQDEWAENRFNLGVIAFFLQLKRDSEKPDQKNLAKTDLLVECENALKSLDTYYSPDRHPQNWLLAQVILAWSKGYPDFKGTELQIVEAVTRALETKNSEGRTITPDKFPVEWHFARFINSVFLFAASFDAAGEARINYLKRAANEQREVLNSTNGGQNIFTPEKLGQQWTLAQRTLTGVLRELTQATSGVEAIAYSRETVGSYKTLLSATAGRDKVFTPERFPQEWIDVQLAFAAAQFDLSNRTTGDESLVALREALAAYKDALAARTGGYSPFSGNWWEIYGKWLLSSQTTPQKWATTQNWVSILSLNLSRRTSGAESESLLNDSIAASRAVLNAEFREKKTKIFLPESFPEEWGGAQNSLGKALTDLGAKTSGDEGLHHLLSALTAHRSVLSTETAGVKIFSPKKLSGHWEVATTGVGFTSAAVNRRLGMTGQIGYLTDAIDAYREVLSAKVEGLKLYSPEHSPKDWLLSKSMFAYLLYELSLRSQGDESTRHLNEAITNYEEILAIKRNNISLFTPQEFPLEMGSTLYSFPQALILRSRRGSGNDALRDLNQAVAVSKSLLEARNKELLIYTPETVPSTWAGVQINLGLALNDLSLRSPSASEKNRLVNSAIEAAKAVIDARKIGIPIFTPTKFPVEWQSAHFILANSYSVLESWNRVSEVYELVLSQFPDHTVTYQNLNLIYSERLFMFDRAYELHRSWLTRHPEDLNAQTSFAAAQFKTGRYIECAQLIGELIKNTGISANSRIGARAIHIANLIAIGRENEVPENLDTLIKDVSDQTTSFSLAWGFFGLKHYIAQQETLKTRLAWMNEFFDGIQQKDRDRIVETLKNLRTRWKE